MIFADTETCGFHGPIVLLQYAIDDGPINLYSPWSEKVGKTKKLIETIVNDSICGFNLSFDWFHLCQLYTTLLLLPDNSYLEDIIDDYAIAEEKARDGPCLKPLSACDVMLHARKGPYQTLMNREDIRIRKVPTPLAQPLANELEKRIKLPSIYFARKKNKFAPQWQVFEREDEDGDYDPEFRDIVMSFAPSTALKALAADVLGINNEDILYFSNVEIDKAYLPVELGYAPYAMAIGNPNDWKGAWPDHIHMHIAHWESNDLARQYASNDVDYTRKLWKHFGSPPPGDDDSELACMVGACRWRGYNVDIEGIKILKTEARKKIGKIPTYSKNVQKWIDPLLSPIERLALKGSTKKTILKKLSELETDCICENGCDKCNDGVIKHPAAIRAKQVLDAREAEREIDLYNKLLTAGRLHADLNVIGTKSSRMSGSGGLNIQGVNKNKRVRSKFLFAFLPDILSGGDFSAFEVVLAIAVWGDKKLEETVTSWRTCHKCEGTGQCSWHFECQGKGCNHCNDGVIDGLNKCFNCKNGKVKTKIHALFGTYMYPKLTYEQILDSDGAEEDYYTKAKSGLFAMMYGGEAYTLATRLGVDTESAEKGYQRFIADYPIVGEARRNVFEQFTALKQTGGLGTNISWQKPADYIEEPILGHRRYFTLENKIIKALYELASSPPKEWKDIKIKVIRRDREQTVSGASQSAVYAAAFQLQSGNCRAAANHVIQSAGAKICKAVQRKIWDLQPSGINPWKVQPLNIHDELMVPNNIPGELRNTVKESVNSFKDRVPLLAIDWHEEISDWSGKKG